MVLFSNNFTIRQITYKTQNHRFFQKAKPIQKFFWEYLTDVVIKYTCMWNWYIWFRSSLYGDCILFWFEQFFYVHYYIMPCLSLYIYIFDNLPREAVWMWTLYDSLWWLLYDCVPMHFSKNCQLNPHTKILLCIALKLNLNLHLNWYWVFVFS